MKLATRFAAVVLLSAVAASAFAQSANRAGRWEFAVLPSFTNGKSMSFDGGASVKTDDSWGFGFGFGYNFNEHFMLGGEFAWSYQDYRATITPGIGNNNAALDFQGTLYTTTWRIQGTWHILSGPSTPYLTAGIGNNYVDTGIQNGAAQPICWYYPWYGYSCASYVPTRTADSTAYSLGAGWRWDLSRSFALKALVQQQWIDFGGYSGSQDFLQFRVDLAWKF